MRTVGIKVLKNKLSEYVRAAEAGETVAVTDRGRVVAEIVPPRPGSNGSVEAFLERGAREGWLTRAERDWREPLPEPGRAPEGDPDIPFDTLMEDLAKDRADRW